MKGTSSRSALCHLSSALSVLVLSSTSMAQVASSYSFSQSAGTFTPITGGTVLQSVTNVMGTDVGAFDNYVSPAQTIPAFNFNGTVHTRMYVSSNGFITFGSAPSATNYTPISSTQTYAGAIAPLGCNLHNTTFAIAPTRDIRWEVVGSEVVVQWRGVRRLNEPNEGFSFQVRLNTATNGIQIVYGPFSAGPGLGNTVLPQCGLRGPNNTSTQVNNRRVTTAGSSSWAASSPGVNYNSRMTLTSTAPARAWNTGQTYTWTPCAAPTVSVLPASPIDLCLGSSVGLTASGASTYTWSPATGLSATTGASVTASPTASITYTITGKNTGCAFTGSTTASIVVHTPTAWYDDNADGDGYGDPAIMMMACSAPAGYVANASDNCPSVYGRIGDSCEDGNPFTSGDVLNGACACVGTPGPTHNWSLRIATDANGGETMYEVVHVGTGFVLHQGGPFPGNAVSDISLSIPDTGHFLLRITDSGGNGIANGGGYLLRDHNGKRVIDNLGNGAGFTSVSQSMDGFYSPVGTDGLRELDCDNVERWPFDMIVAKENPAVSAQWQVGDQTDDGYEFWFTDPNGSYSRRIFRDHAKSGGYGPANAQRACKLGLASFTVNPLPENTLLNVRVRGVVNGVPQPWGPACRTKIDQVAANCHTTRLEDQNEATMSCGVSGLRTDGSSRIWAKPVARYIRATNSYVNANRYKFHFVNVGENTSFDLVMGSYPMLIYPQMPFQLGATYDVTVQASLDGGTTYCPAGASCQISFAATNAHMAVVNDAPAPVTDLLLWPNPNRGNELFLHLDHMDEATDHVTVVLTDMTGKQVAQRLITTAGSSLNAVLPLSADLANGLYLVNLTVGDRSYTKRLVIEH